MSDTIIPERGTKEFAKYRAGVEWEAQQGAKIECQWRPDKYKFRSHDWEDHTLPKVFVWDEVNYRVAPTPHPIDQWRAMSKDERGGKVLETADKGRLNWGPSRYMDTSLTVEAIDKAEGDYRIRELTLAERNDEVRERWEAMKETDDKAFRRDKDGKRWFLESSNNGQFWSKWSRPFDADYVRIVEVPEPPKPKFVPWTRETCPVGAVVVDNANNKHTILSAYGDGAHIGGCHAFVSFKELLNSRRPWRMADGSPCGTEAKP